MSILREKAESLVSHLVSANRELSAAVNQVETMEDCHEARSIRRTLANVIGTVAADAIAPILAIYPDLDPYLKDE